MTKQRLEGDFTRILKELGVWYMKLQVNVNAHTATPADYIILTKNKRILVECKECRGKSFTFDRLTQYGHLSAFVAAPGSNYSYVLICFWLGTKKKSLYYMIPIQVMGDFMQVIPKKSANIMDFNLRLGEYRYDYADIRLIFNI